MVTRLLFGLALLAGCAGSSKPRDNDALHLHGFHLVDPRSRSVRDEDLFIDNGLVLASATPGRHYTVIEGNGRWLLPAMWDLKVSLWGNNSAKNYDDLSQDMGITQCLRVELFYGVAHVGVFGMDWDWVGREIKRAKALELPAAELLYPDKALGGAEHESFACVGIRKPAELSHVLDTLEQKRVPYVQMFYGDPKSKVMPGLSRDLLQVALEEATRRRLKGYVLVDDWEHAADAVEFGAAAIHGLPRGVLSDRLIVSMRERGVAYAPALAGVLELDRILGNEQALREPLLTVSVPPEILSTFREPKALWSGWQPSLALAKTTKRAALADVKRMADGGVHLLSATDTGWTSGTFQGFSTHAAQVWFEKAGVDAWTRLAAVTIWPADFVGRGVGFRGGDSADFLVLDANPLEGALHLRELAFLIRDGRVVQRGTLKPDLSRGPFRP